MERKARSPQDESALPGITSSGRSDLLMSPLNYTSILITHRFFIEDAVLTSERASVVTMPSAGFVALRLFEVYKGPYPNFQHTSECLGPFHVAMV